MTGRFFRAALAALASSPSLGSLYRLICFPRLGDWITPRKAAMLIAVHPFTMLSRARLESLRSLALVCNRENIRGAFVECGTWKGGSAAVLAASSGASLLWLFDSFMGCPSPTSEDISCKGRPGTQGECRASPESMIDLFRRLHLDLRDVNVEAGWFSETIPAAVDSIGRIALLHLDGDWYESTKTCLKYLFPLVVPGGFIQVDDFYYWRGAEKAVREYFAAHGVPLHFTRVDHTAIWIRKADG